jgi:hypothetical protein
MNGLKIILSGKHSSLLSLGINVEEKRLSSFGFLGILRTVAVGLPLVDEWKDARSSRIGAPVSQADAI